MTESQPDSLQKQLEIHQRTLLILEEKAAAFGLYLPSYMQIEMDTAEDKIAEIEAALGLPPSRKQPKPGSLNRLWNLPHRPNPNFTGRVKHLETLSQLNPLIAAICGLGGTGKTQLAVEFLHLNQAKYRVVWWLRAEQPISLAEDFVGLGLALGFPAQPDQQQAEIDQVHNWLAHNSGWLLVFDNATDPTEIEPYLPRTRDFAVLVTSRNLNWRGTFHQLDLAIWNEAEALEFLEKRTGQADETSAKELTHELGYLPLALEQAAAYIQEKGKSLEEYLTLYRKYHLEILERAKPSQNYHNDTVATTWQISLQELSPAATTLLNICAYLAPDDIPLSLFQDYAEELPEPLATVAADELEFDDTLADLRRYALAEIADGTLSLHRLLQLVIRERDQEAEVGEEEPNNSQNETAENATSENPALTSALYLLYAATPDTTDYDTWAEYAPILPHALAVAEHAESLEIEPETTGYILNQAGIYLQGRADYQTSLKLYQRAITINEKALGEDHPDIANVYTNLGNLLRDMDDLPNARIYYDKALAIREKTLDKEDPDIAQSYNNLGSLLQAMGDLPTARIYLDKAIAIGEKTLGTEHPDIAVWYNNLGMLLQELGDLSSARVYFDKALKIAEEELGTDHPDVARSYTNLGSLLQDLGELTTARIYYDKALKIFEQELGTDHPAVAQSYNNLGILLRDLGELTAARVYLDKALKIVEEKLGPDHPNTQLLRRNLASLGEP